MTYQLRNNSITGKTTGVIFHGEGFIKSIPADPDNTDYQEYLTWLAEGNEPLPADS